MPRFLILLLALASLLPTGAGAQTVASRAGDVAPADDYAAALTGVLQRVVAPDGRVRYDLLGGALRDDFRKVLKAVETFDAAALKTDREKMAFWINAYNVQMLQHILDAPRVTDVLAGGAANRFFKTKYRTAGKALSLDDIEHVILRRQDGPDAVKALAVARLDPRLHVGLNCAAVSCPTLLRTGLTPANLDAVLDDAMKAFADSPRHFRADGRTYVVSSLLDWFGADFDATGAPAGDFLLRFMSPSRPGYKALQALLKGRNAAALKTRPDVVFAYDWTVNRAN